jgi:hypothetical protein
LAIKKGLPLSAAAAKAGMSEPTARKYRRAGKLPTTLVAAHTWRTRPDPFEAAWKEVEALLAREPRLHDETVALECTADALGDLLYERLQLPLGRRGDAAEHGRRRTGEKHAVDPEIARCTIPSTRVSASASVASRNRSANGSDSTHWRSGFCGSTSSARSAAVSVIRRAPQLGQKPRRLQLNAK